MKIRMQYYKMMIGIFEKYGFNVVPSVDQKTIILSNVSDGKLITPCKTIHFIVKREDLELYISDVEPFHIAGWKITLL